MSDFPAIPKVPLVDPTTGMMSVQWQGYFTTLNRAMNALGGVPATPTSTPVLALAWKGPWVSTTTYFPGDEVSYNGDFYRSILESLNVNPSNATFWLLYTVNTPGIISNAATYTIVQNDNASGTIGPGVTGKQNLGVVVNPVSPAYDCTAILTATIQADQPTGTLGDVKVLVGFADSGSGFSYSPQETGITSTTFASYTLQWQFAHLGSNAGHGQAAIFFDVGANTDIANWQTATIQVEYIIR